MDLNPSQRDAVTTVAGPLLVLAGAGSGKTRVVTYRIAELIRRGTPPERILAVTFTRKAAGEMLERAGKLLGKRSRSSASGRAASKKKPLITTFHALCVQILRRQIHHLEYPRSFAIYDRADQESLARATLRELSVAGEMMRPGDLLAAISRWKTASIRPAAAEAVAATDREHLAAMAYRRYQRALQARAAVDFDDLLLLTEELLQDHPQVRHDEAGRFSHLMVDEYQDTNAPQYAIVRHLAGGHRNLCVVGDDDQSIYGWRGADVRHILRFRHDWPDAKVVRLEENYRSRGPILEMANRLIARNRKRHAKTLRAVRPGGDRPRLIQYPTELHEARGVVGEVHSLVTAGKAAAGDVVILFRTNEQTRAFETELRRIGLAYVVIGGTSFFDRKEVRDILAYLKVISQPRDDVSLLRIINTPPRGIGQSSVAKLVRTAAATGRGLWDVLAEPDPERTLATTAAIAAFRELIESMRGRMTAGRLSQGLASLIETTGYEQEVARTSKTPAERSTRWSAVAETINAMADYAGQHPRGTLRSFLDEVTLDPRLESPDKASKLRRDCVTLMTLHSAKGLEFPHVYMVGMEEGKLPHHRGMGELEESIEEERRLCYVGITRAQDHLTLTLAGSRRKWGKPRPTLPSRFLNELVK